MVIANLREQAKRLKNKVTSKGLKNPRLVRAQTQEAEERSFRKDLAKDIKVFSKREIATTYTDEYVADLVQRANANLKRMVGPALRPYWLPEE